MSPRAALIRRLQAALGEQDTVPTPDVSRALTFGSAGDSEPRSTSSRRPADSGPEEEPAPTRARLGEVGADAFEGLRPAGEERADAERVMRELEAQMGGTGT
eukprot:1355382-Pleurochrysis_carterae.AAC.1